MDRTGVKASHAEQIRACYGQSVRHYDTSIRVFERLLFGDGRARVCSRARDDALK